jgi:ElaB/YqjD/DUF883 family membrane-anchored ribosome-binding protein
LPGSAFDWPGHTNLASGIHHESYDCDNHNEAAEHVAKLEAGLLPSNINVLIFDHLVSAAEQRVWNGKSFRSRHICKPPKDAYENSGDTFRDGSQAIAKKVQDNPLGSMLIAGGIGFALALLMTRPPQR